MMEEFKNKNIVLVTKHDKGKVIKPLMEEETGCNIICDNSLDTDQFGTFVRDIQRKLSQKETARAKIYAALEGTEYTLGMASEGSFGPHPYYPVPWNVEIVMLHDIVSGFEVQGMYEGFDTNFAHRIVSSFEEAVSFAEKIGFPGHHLILRPDNEYSGEIFKGIDSWEILEKVFDICLRSSSEGSVFMETDMRAFANPTRMANIGKAVTDLIEKLKNRCPVCGAPGFIVVEKIPGLRCELCGGRTKLIEKTVSCCQSCAFREEKPRSDILKAPAKYCDYCNP